MKLEFDPFDMRSSSTSGEKKKRAFLVGKDPTSKKVQFLAKMALYRGQSINCYHLISKNRRKFVGRVDPEFEKMRDELMSKGHEIDYPNDIPEDDVDRWITHGKEEAKKLGLQVAE